MRNPKKLWKTLKHAVSTHSIPSTPSFIEMDGQEITDPLSMADAFNYQSFHQHTAGCKPGSGHSQRTDNWLKAMDKKKFVGSIFLDLSKAFYLVSMSVLQEHKNAVNMLFATILKVPTAVRVNRDILEMEGHAKESHRCKCKPGFTGDERTCKDMNECASGTQNCSADAVCNSTKGSYNCTCKPGHYGDGNICRSGGKTGFDFQETKLPTYWDTSFSNICLGMKIGNQLRFIVINKHAESLHSLIADGKKRTISLGRKKWKTLIGLQTSLQPHCNMEGFNVVGEEPHQSKSRIGITANQQNDCSSCDSRIGFGAGRLHDGSNTCGNEATREPDNGDKLIKAMGYILVQ
ncbi:Nidogen-1 [Stylophora pistillata]|uniref:Nidogen-1 n=1 Tax=Stylophora pistillata TaxID=50429 RepID=A0A2B4RVI7_STYPI|nr:Nidogen-1 [Stylophora pistillata]